MIQTFEGKIPTLRTLNEYSSRESTKPMSRLAERVNRWTAAQIAAIIDEAQDVLLTLGPKHEACISATSTEAIDTATFTSLIWLEYIY